MQARILGSFQLEEGGRRIPLGGVRQRAVFVGLLLHANEVVPSEQLLMDLWGDDSPPGAANSLQAAISRLRRVLPQGRLITEAAGLSAADLSRQSWTSASSSSWSRRVVRL